MAVTTNQTHFRVRTDSTAAQGGTPVWAAALDTNPAPGSIAVGTPFRIRFAISDTGSTSTASNPWDIFVSRNGGAFAAVTTSTTFVIATDATAGASANNSAISTSLLGGTGTFLANGVYNDTGATSSLSITHGDFVEFEFGLQFTTSVVEGDTYQFEVFFNSAALSSYTVIPTLTIPLVATYGNEPQQQLVQPSWLPDPNPVFYDFIGGNSPYFPRKLAASLLGPPLVQQDYRVRTDATAAQGGTAVWQANQNVTTPATNATIGSRPIGTAFRIRFSVYDSGTTGTSGAFQLYASRNGGAYAAVTASTTYVITTDATAGASANNSAITTALLTETTGTFSGVGVYNDTGSTSSVSLPGGDRCEFEFGIEFTTSCSIGDTFAFKIYYNNAPFGTYTNIPTMVAGGNVSLPVVNLLASINFQTSLRDDFGGQVGLQFTTPASPPIIVTSLGMWVNAQNTAVNTVELVDSATGNAVIASVTINTGNVSPGFNYVSITPVTLTASHTYFLARNSTAAGDFWWNADDGGSGNKLPVTSGVATVGGSEYESGTTWNLNNPGLFCYAGVDLITGNPPFSIPSLDPAGQSLAVIWQTATDLANAYTFIGGNAPFVQRYLSPAITGAVVAANPPFTNRDIVNSILAAWIPPSPVPIVATPLNPAISAVPVNNPPFNSRDNSSGVLAAWIPPPPQPIIAGQVNPATEAVEVDNPPFSHYGRSVYVQQAIAASSWQPDPVYYQFVGGQAPYVPRYLAPSITAVPVSNPIPAVQGQMPWWTWWLPPDPAPQIGPKLSQGPPAAAPILKTADFTAINAGWNLPAPPAVIARNLPPAITAVEVDNPPFSQRNNLPGILAAWIPPPPDPIVAGRVSPALETIPVSNPPFGIPQPSLTGILSAWIPPPPQPIVAGNVNAVFEAVPVNNPPFGVPSPSLGIIRAAWEPPPPAPIVAGPVGPALETAPVINNPPFSHPGRNEAVSRSVAAWQPDPVFYQFAGGSAPFLPRYLPPAITAVPVNNPPFGAKPALTGLAAWDIQALPVLPARVAATAFVVPVPVSVDQVSIAGAWKVQDGYPVLARYLAPQLLVRADQPPPLRRQDISGAWIASDPVPQQLRYLPQAFVPPVINNPPPGGRNITAQLIWWSLTDSLQLKPFYAMTAQPLLFIDPKYFISGPVSGRALSSPVLFSRATVGPSGRIASD